MVYPYLSLDIMIDGSVEFYNCVSVDSDFL